MFFIQSVGGYTGIVTVFEGGYAAEDDAQKVADRIKERVPGTAGNKITVISR